MSADYSTESQAPRHRFEYWKEVVCRHCIPAFSKPLEEHKFDGQLRVRGLGVLDVHRLLVHALLGAHAKALADTP